MIRAIRKAAAAVLVAVALMGVAGPASAGDGDLPIPNPEAAAQRIVDDLFRWYYGVMTVACKNDIDC